MRARQRFRKIHPTPAWATKAREAKARALMGITGSDESDAEDGEDQEDRDTSALTAILQSSNAGLSSKLRQRGALPAGELAVTRLRDANQLDPSHGKSGITTLQFHPSSQVLFTTSEDRRLKLFSIDGTHHHNLRSTFRPFQSFDTSIDLDRSHDLTAMPSCHHSARSPIQ